MSKFAMIAHLGHTMQYRFDLLMGKRKISGNDARRAVMLKQGLARLQLLHPFGPRPRPLP